ncbi:GNAT family N-acetyltransferase [Actinoplanes sp. Pm04-4]|uniref:GNAT family N-acetyltransferase n=1 Tax=Paractinoplanes pyxinae TaxID=2997416 RepID=A0ABT4BB03_9ACTN|nr:GNAT family N-acetyltransferase [Actinoplanes pyxinae]MCY1143706.1 GNAT family N-acetyltransferase [Actinoplanes pyxinae]
MTYVIRRMTPGEWRKLRAIRLEAVRDTPTAFSCSYTDLASRTEIFWQEQAAVEATSDQGATFVACGENDDWVGSASVEPLAEVPDHAHIHAVYLRAEHRGPTGLGAHLVEAAIRFAEQHIDVSRLTLGVHESNVRALNFYHRIGFQMTNKVIPYRPNSIALCRIMEYTNFRRRKSSSNPAHQDA